MKGVIGLSPPPVLIEERILDDRSAKFGKTVVERDFKMPNGTTASVLCITSPGIDPYIIFPLTEQGTVLLVKQFRFAINEWIYELPGGCPKPGQAWEAAASSELMEEVGAEATSMEIIGSPMSFNPPLQSTRFTAVLARGCKVVQSQNLDSTEVMVGVEFTLKEFREMLKKGDITDSKTVAIGYLALDHLGLLG